MKNQPPSWSYPSAKYREVKKSTDFNPTPMGGGRSYGDANFVGKVFGARKHSKILQFNPITEIATFGSGVSIQEALNLLYQLFQVQVMPQLEDASLRIFTVRTPTN